MTTASHTHEDSPKEIMIVEDSLTQAIKLEHLLKLHGYQTIMASDGQSALDLLSHHKPHMVITDVLMPRLDGYELCRRINAQPALKQMPVMLLTSLSEPEDIIKGVACGANNFVIKPYDENVLLSVIRHIFDNIKLRETPSADLSFKIRFQGQQYQIAADRTQMIDMLFSAFENMLYKTRALEKANQELQKAVETIKTLKGLIPICSHCKKIRNDRGFWEQVEVYIGKHSNAMFSHGICPDCLRVHYPGYVPHENIE